MLICSGIQLCLKRLQNETEIVCETHILVNQKCIHHGARIPPCIKHRWQIILFYFIFQTAQAWNLPQPRAIRFTVNIPVQSPLITASLCTNGIPRQLYDVSPHLLCWASCTVWDLFQMCLDLAESHSYLSPPPFSTKEVVCSAFLWHIFSFCMW